MSNADIVRKSILSQPYYAAQSGDDTPPIVPAVFKYGWPGVAMSSSVGIYELLLRALALDVEEVSSDDLMRVVQYVRYCIDQGKANGKLRPEDGRVLAELLDELGQHADWFKAAESKRAAA